MPLSKPILRVTGLTKRYGRFTALDDVSFSIARGEIVGLIGPNGAGKTTLFACLAGVLAREAGEILGDERPLAAGNSILFYVPDGIAPWPAQTVRWGLDFAQGFFGAAARQTRDEIVKSLGLSSLLDQRIGTLSKGQRKRALLAIGLLTPHPVLVIDEPFEGLDLRQTRDMAAALRLHATKDRTLLLSIHQIADAARVCDRFVLLSGGRVRGDGTVDELAALAAARHPMLGAGASLEETFLALT